MHSHLELKDKINSDLQPLILEAMRRKDEEAPEDIPESVIEQIGPLEEAPADRLNRLKQRIQEQIGQQCGLEDLYQDDLWDTRMAQLSKAGEFFDFGKMMLVYVDRGDRCDYILIPGQKTTVMAVDPKCPRDKLIRVISE